MPAGAARTEGHGLAVWRPNACWERGEGDVSLHKEAVAWVWRVLQGAVDPSTTVVPPGWPGAVCSAKLWLPGRQQQHRPRLQLAEEASGHQKGRPAGASECAVWCVLRSDGRV